MEENKELREINDDDLENVSGGAYINETLKIREIIAIIETKEKVPENIRREIIAALRGGGKPSGLKKAQDFVERYRYKKIDFYIDLVSIYQLIKKNS